MTAVEEDVDDRFAGIDIDSLLNRTDHRPKSYGRKKALYEAPEFIQRLNGEETVMEGQSLCIECKIRGFPVPTLRWFKDDEEILDHPRIHVESNGTGGYSLLIDNVHKGDEAAYRCRAENVEGACSSFFFLSVKSKPKSQKKKDQKNSSNRRTVSFPPMFATIVEKVEEEEKQGKELQQLPPSPMTDFYYALTLKGRQSWPTFVGDWAFVNGGHKRRNSTGSVTESCGYSSEDDVFTDEEDDNNNDENEYSDELEAKTPFFYLSEDVDSGDFSSTQSMIVSNSNMQTFQKSPEKVIGITEDLQNNNNLVPKRSEVLDNDKSHVIEVNQSEVSNAHTVRKADSAKFGSHVEGTVAGVLVPLPGNATDTTPPIVVELWDESCESQIVKESHNYQGISTAVPNKNNALELSAFSREEREPTPFLNSDKGKAGTSHITEKSKEKDSTNSGQNLLTGVTKEFHRELTPFYDNKTQTEIKKRPPDHLSVHDSTNIFQRESTPYYKDESIKDQASFVEKSTHRSPATLSVGAGLQIPREVRESTPYYKETNPYEYIHHPDHHFSEKTAVIRRKSIPEGDLLPSVSLATQGMQPLSNSSKPMLTSEPQRASMQPQNQTSSSETATRSQCNTSNFTLSGKEGSTNYDNVGSFKPPPKPTTLNISNSAPLSSASVGTSPVLSYNPQQFNKNNITDDHEVKEQNKKKEDFAKAKQDSTINSESIKTYAEHPSINTSSQTKVGSQSTSQGKPTSKPEEHGDVSEQKATNDCQSKFISDTENKDAVKSKHLESKSSSELASQNERQNKTAVPTSSQNRQIKIPERKSQTVYQQSHVCPQDLEPNTEPQITTNISANQLPGVSGIPVQNNTFKEKHIIQPQDKQKKMPMRDELSTVQNTMLAPISVQETFDSAVKERQHCSTKPTTKQKETFSQLSNQVVNGQTQEVTASLNLRTTDSSDVRPDVKLDDVAKTRNVQGQRTTDISEMKIEDVAKTRSVHPQTQTVLKKVSETCSSLAQEDTAIQPNETKLLEKHLPPRQLLVSAKNIYPVEINANDSVTQTKGKLKATKSFKASKKKQVQKISANQTSGDPNVTNERRELSELTNQNTGTLENTKVIEEINKDTSVRKKKTSSSGFSNSISTFFKSKRRKGEDKDINKTTDKTKLGDSKKTKDRIAPRTSQPSSVEVAQRQPVKPRSISKEKLAKCSPFGPYTIEGLCCLFALTIFCLHIEMPIERFVCYVLAAFYTFCVMRLLGVIF